MTKKLDHKIALITGASRGIGAAVALELAKNGAHVIALARSVGGLEELDDQIKAMGGNATLLPLDLSKGDKIDSIGPTIAERFGRLDIFIGNAGMLGPLSPCGHIKPKDWDKVMAVNFHANIRLIRTLDPLLHKSEAGRVLFTTTDLADQCPAYWGPYSTSKAALNAFMHTYAAETQEGNLRVNAIHPGSVQTKMMEEAFPGGTPFKTKQPHEVASDFIDLVDESCVQHGQIIKLP
ncbi:MAG: SDR family NAD(P)-dependent oxidoreductase [Alphaproteobacteria bacterium]